MWLFIDCVILWFDYKKVDRSFFESVGENNIKNEKKFRHQNTDDSIDSENHNKIAFFVVMNRMAHLIELHW